MEQRQIIQGNKIIGAFMEKDFGQTSLGWLRACKYHKSWDWIMEVVERIEAAGYDVHIVRRDSFVHQNTNIGSTSIAKTLNAQSKIEAVWLASVAFIKMYNRQIPVKR